jgi:hypothetical protein
MVACHRRSFSEVKAKLKISKKGVEGKLLGSLGGSWALLRIEIMCRFCVIFVCFIYKEMV